MPPDFVYAWPEAGMFLLILAVTGFVAALVHFSIERKPLRHLSQKAADLSPAIPTLCGTLFVLSVTFLANSVWQSEQRAREAVQEEARNIRVIRTYVGAMAGSSQDSLMWIISNYAKAVAREWPHMAQTDANATSETELAAIYTATLLGLAEGEQNRLLQQRVLSALDALSSARQQRLTMARDVVSGGQWFLVSTLALLLIVVISLTHGRFPAARFLALGVVTIAISVALFVILAHDRPFIGYLAVAPDAIVEAASNGPAR